jgi:hypothetical protein
MIMKHRSTILIALLLAAAPVTAQAQLGVKAGGSFGNVSNRGVLPGSLDTRTGFAAGVSLGLGSGLLGLGIEGLYAQRGVNSDGSPNDSRRLDYVDVPAYLRVTLPTPIVKPFAYAGPQVSFEVRCQANGVQCPDTAAGGVSRKKTDFAGVVGAGVRISGLSIEGRYIYGLTDLKLNTVTNTDSYKTRSFLVLAGFSF